MGNVVRFAEMAFLNRALFKFGYAKSEAAATLGLKGIQMLLAAMFFCSYLPHFAMLVCRARWFQTAKIAEARTAHLGQQTEKLRNLMERMRRQYDVRCSRNSDTQSG